MIRLKLSGEPIIEFPHLTKVESIGKNSLVHVISVEGKSLLIKLLPNEFKKPRSFSQARKELRTYKILMELEYYPARNIFSRVEEITQC